MGIKHSPLNITQPTNEQTLIKDGKIISDQEELFLEEDDLQQSTVDQSQNAREANEAVLINQLGSQLHDEWRAPRMRKDGSYEPRVKKTTDQAWIAKHGTNEVDIANTAYAELPDDWQRENRISAEIAIEETFSQKKQVGEFDAAFVETASERIHNCWMDRRKTEGYDENDSNWQWAVSLMILYADLPEEEKEKDRAIIRKAMKLFAS